MVRASLRYYKQSKESDHDVGNADFRLLIVGLVVRYEQINFTERLNDVET